MEVETRISVQAMRGKFEQLPDDNTFPCVGSPTSKLNISPNRPRTSSLIFKDRDANCNKTKQSNKVKNLSDDEREKISKNTKHSPVSVSKTKSVISDFVSPILTSSKVAKALSGKKHSVDTGNGHIGKRSVETQQNENSVETTPSRKISETYVADTKPSVVKRIPVFKSFNGVYASENKPPVKNDDKDSTTESQGKRERFFGHIRSRSHGNFMIKRDLSAERNSGLTGRGEGTGKLGNESVDFQWKNLRQKSSDNLYEFRDSKCSSPFEGKQKLVANVVKNMKNKERPKVLRKFSFTSKTEKEFKNKKEKAYPDDATDTVTPNKSNLCVIPNTAKMEAIAKSTVNERRASFTGVSICSGPVSVAKAVADIALEKSTRSPELKDKVQSSGDETSPPSRPPRRRSATCGLSSHKKGMAPSPPGPPLGYQNGIIKETSCLDKVPSDITLGLRLSPDFERSGYQDSPDYSKSSDSLASPLSSDISRENSPIMKSQNSPELQKHLCKSSITIPDINRVYLDTSSPVEDNSVNKKGLQKTPQTPQGAFTRSSLVLDNGDTELDIEVLPPGPPPKKPPRTFAYDIYKSSKESKSAEDVSSKSNDCAEEKSENMVPLNSGPVYAIPLKKKKSESRLTTKTPVRSNSDLSKRDLIKPAVAPKPPHISNKVKRSSVVDPLSSTEKSEEAIMASEFQRQAHIRYSLRRPKKPPPAPPPDSEMEGKPTNESVCSSSEKFLAESPSALDEDYTSSEDNIDKGNNRKNILESNRGKFSHHSSNGVYESVNSDSEDEGPTAPTIRLTSQSSYNLHVPTAIEDNQPLSLGHCPVDAFSSDLAGTYRKRSMSDETLHKGSRFGEEPIYAMPDFANSKGSHGNTRQRELHYMCSVLFTNEEEADAGRDGRGHAKNGESAEGNKVKSSIISAWKREFRQSCRQVQNKIKKTVNR